MVYTSLIFKLASLALILKSAWASNPSTCYYQNGTVNANGTVCDPTGDFSLCCEDGEACLVNNICFRKSDTSFNTGSCTDKTWKSNKCFQDCPKDFPFGTLYRCDDDYWCTSGGNNQTSCCDDDDAWTYTLSPSGIYNGTGQADGYMIEGIPSSGSQTHNSAPAGSATPGSTPSGSATPGSAIPGSAAPASCSHGSSINNTDTQITADDCSATERNVGLGVGLGTGAPLLAIIGALSILLFRQKRQLRELRSAAMSRESSQRLAPSQQQQQVVSHWPLQVQEAASPEVGREKFYPELEINGRREELSDGR